MDKSEEAHNVSAWFVTRRWFEYEGEIRTALFRVWMVAALFGLQLLQFYFFSGRTAADWLFHRQASIIVTVWLFVSLIVMVSFLRRYFPSYLKFITSGADLLLLMICAGLGSGPASPLVGLFFLLIVTAALRCSLPLVWFTTLGSLLAYLALVGYKDATWFDADHTTPPITQLVMMTSLLATGFATGQLVRMIRQLARDYASRQLRLTEQTASHE